MFSKILIANRGEIACRIIRTARRMGVRTVAVHSDADVGARHVAMADEAVHIGPSAPAQSYLRGDEIIRIARETGADAIHPGYGFLSENPDFVDAVEKAGLTFIGPSSDAIRAMGLKDAAKKLMAKAGVPIVPGYHGTDQNPKHLAREARKIGYPVLIKAVAGGGGKGMRRVDAPADFADALASAQSEAKTAFGNDAVLIEKFVTSPRHIEMQIFGDGTDAVHLFERDCSLQRRHQKVIEEAPAPGMTAKVRAAMGDAAVRAAMAIGYRGAGTVEFIVDASAGLKPDGFWFMEMNTRLQVEHPVSEAITGVDLVEWQLRVAAGENLPARQGNLSINGHAFEARLYAEDVPKGFLPATGTLDHLVFPGDARADTGVRAGDVISPWYDPMIAKLITHGPTRAVALARLQRALEKTEIAGTVTNLTFLSHLSRQPEFARGEVDTGLIERNISDLAHEDAAPPEICAIAALAALNLHEAPVDRNPFSLWSPLEWSAEIHEGETRHAARIRADDAGGWHVRLGEFECRLKSDGRRWRADTAPAPARVIRLGNDIHVYGRQTHHFTTPDPLARAAETANAGNVVAAPMPGLVKRVFAIAGKTVAAGDKLAILEAMKMEHVLTATRDGEVAEVLTAAGDQVEAGQPLILLAGDAL